MYEEIENECKGKSVDYIQNRLYMMGENVGELMHKYGEYTHEELAFRLHQGY